MSRRLWATIGKFASWCLALVWLSGCTGSETAITPLALVVAGQGPSGGTVALLVSPLPPSGTPRPPEEVGWQGTLTVTLTGSDGEPVTIRDVVTVGGSVQEAWVLARGNRDYLFVASIEELRLDGSASWSWTSAPVDLSSRVAVAGTLAGESLCAVLATASRDGRWLGLVHDPARCGGSSSSVPAVILLDLQADATDPNGVRPRVASTNDARFPPVFGDWRGTQSLLWSTVDGTILALATTESGSSPTPVATSEATTIAAPTGAGLGGRGFVVLDDDALAVVPLDGSEALAPFDPDLPGAVTSVVDPASFDDRAVVVRTSAGITYLSGVGTASRSASNGAASGAVDAIVDPYGYVYVATPSSVVAFDLLAAGTTLRTAWSSGLDGSDLTSIVAMDWTYLASSGP